MTDIAIVSVESLALAFDPRPWPFAEARRAEINAHFAALRRVRPAVWNGRVLLLHEHAIAAGVFRGTFLETDYASFIAWRDWGFPDTTVKNGFAMGALRSADGAFVLGVMAAHTLNAGLVYFPAGTPEPADVVGGRVDLTRGVLREMAEETGLGTGDFLAEPSWQAVLAGPRIALMKTMHAAVSAETLRERIRAHLAREVQPELSDVRIVRGPADLIGAMPGFVTAYLAHIWAAESDAK